MWLHSTFSGLCVSLVCITLITLFDLFWLCVVEEHICHTLEGMFMVVEILA